MTTTTMKSDARTVSSAFRKSLFTLRRKSDQTVQMGENVASSLDLAAERDDQPMAERQAGAVAKALRRLRTLHTELDSVLKDLAQHEGDEDMIQQDELVQKDELLAEYREKRYALAALRASERQSTWSPF